MDAGTLVIEGAIALASGVAGVLGAVWALSSRLMRIENKAADAEKLARETDGKLEDFMKGEAEQWAAMNRTLGQMEGALGLSTPQPGRPPFRGRP